jgi:ComF family protein
MWLGRWLLEALFPPRCIICKREGFWLCDIHKSFAPAPKNEAHFQFLDEIFAATAYYHPTSQKLIEYFKFRGFQSLADIMADQILENIPESYIKNYTLVPIPLHWTRKLWRGFNQSEILALAIQKRIPVLSISFGLKRKQKTQQQAKLKRSERLKNLTAAFSWEGEEIPPKILLVDDVVASGSTLDSAARMLKERGAKNVSGVVFARGGKPCQNSNNET